MKKLLLMALLSFFGVQHSIANTLDNAVEQVEKVVISPLEKLVFEKDCTEQRALDFVKEQMKEGPELFEAYDWQDNIKLTVLDLNLINIKIDEKAMAQEKEKDRAEALKWIVARKKVIAHLLEKAGAQRTVLEEDIERFS